MTETGYALSAMFSRCLLMGMFCSRELAAHAIMVSLVISVEARCLHILVSTGLDNNKTGVCQRENKNLLLNLFVSYI